MQTRNAVLAVVAVAVLAAGWYAFRPERLFINKTVSETLSDASQAAGTQAMTESGPQLIASGAFHSGSHETHGQASIYQRSDGTRVLRLTDFETSNGPDVQVYLVAAEDATDNATVTKAGFINVGALKGNQGDQNYDLPADLDLGTYQAVTIWCRRFGVNFGTAPIRSVRMNDRMMGGATALVSGSFHGVSHETHGTATVYRLANGKRVLRFTDFETSNGPDVQVYLVAASDANDNATVTNAGFIQVAALKGNQGDQNYELADDVDLGKYRAVTIWCRRFGVNFATAPLSEQRS